MTDTIRIGFVGAGNKSRSTHIPNLQKQEGVEIVVVSNRTPESSQRVADEFGISRIAASWEDVVADPEVDAVVIGTWPYMHAKVTIAALEAGKHVLCEARMAMNLGEAKAMLAASEARPELITQLVPSPGAFVMDRFLNRVLNEEKVIGDILLIDVPGGAGFINFEKEISWREQRVFSGYNAIGLGIGYEAFCRWATPAKTVKAVGRIFVKQRKNAEGGMETIEIPDHLDIIGELESGASYTIRSSRITGANQNTTTQAFGSTGTLEILAGEKKGLVHRPDGTTEELLPKEGEIGSWRTEEEFIGAIRGTEEIRYTTFADGVRYMAFTEEVMKSAGLD